MPVPLKKPFGSPFLLSYDGKNIVKKAIVKKQNIVRKVPQLPVDLPLLSGFFSSLSVASRLYLHSFEFE